MSGLTHGELFAGLSGFGVGFERAGMKTVWRVEIDRDCQRVIRRHYPDALLLDDVRECGVHNLPRVDIISFGSPCQDLSVAGKRKGLDGERSGLFYEAVRIIRELRPRFAIWENVPGALSSSGGRDFGAALDALADAGALDIGWAVLDAQWFGVAQRRRRVFTLADFGGRCAYAIFPESQGGCWNPAPSREARERVAAPLTAGAPSTSNPAGRRREDDVNLAVCLEGHAPRYDLETETLVAHTLCAEGADAGEDGTGRGVPLVMAFGWQDSHTTHNPVKGDGETAAISVAKQDAVAVFDERNVTSRTNRSRVEFGRPSPTLHEKLMSLIGNYGVRRLTPRECERLMGFPDSWTACDADGKPISDSARYRMLGNAVAVPVATWIGKRIVDAAR